MCKAFVVPPPLSVVSLSLLVQPISIFCLIFWELILYLVFELMLYFGSNELILKYMTNKDYGVSFYFYLTGITKFMDNCTSFLADRVLNEDSDV